jgi:hypothetical protein
MHNNNNNNKRAGVRQHIKHAFCNIKMQLYQCPKSILSLARYRVFVLIAPAPTLLGGSIVDATRPDCRRRRMAKTEQMRRYRAQRQRVNGGERAAP